MARSIHDLAVRAQILYHPPGVDEAMYEIWIEEAFRQFVRDCGGIYTTTSEITLVPGTREYALSDRVRRIKPHGVYIYYAERTISTAVRTSNVVTITTSSAHGLAAGVEIVIANVTAAGATDFDGTFTVVEAPTTTTFTYASTAADDTGTGGSVNATSTDETFLEWKDDGEVVNEAGWQSTQGDVTAYSFPDERYIAFYQIPNGDFPTAVIRYDAFAPATLDVDTSLPILDYDERTLLGYAKEQAALAAGDERTAQIGRVQYNEGVKQRRSDAHDRQQIGSRNADPANSTEYNVWDHLVPRSSRGTF